MYFGSRHAHNTRKESTDSSRRNVAEEMSQVLFSIVTGIKGAMVGYIDEAASISHGMVMRMIDAVDILENNCEIDSLANQRWSHYYKRL